MLEFTHPDMLAGLLVIALCALPALVMVRDKSFFWIVCSTGLPLLAGALALCAAAGPWLQVNSPAKRIIVALDFSPAAITAPWHNPQWLQDFLQRHVPANVRVTLVGFAKRPHIITSTLRVNKLGVAIFPATAEASAQRGLLAAPQRRFQRHKRAGTPALPVPPGKTTWPQHLLPASHHSASTGRLLEFSGSTPCWIFTTGLLRWNLPDHHIMPIAPMAITLIPPAQIDAGITNLQLENPAVSTITSSHDKLTAIPPLEATVRATGPANLTIEERLDHKILARTQVRFFKPGMKMVLFPVSTANSTGNNSELTVVLHSDDPWPGDNKASIEIPSAGQRSVLIVTRNSTTQRIADADWKITELPPGQFPDSFNTLTRFQAVILDNISVDDLRSGAEQSLSNYVTHTGGGLLITGTNNAFGPGGYGLPQGNTNRPSTLERLSPLSCLPPHPRPRHIVFLLDASGSMGNITASGMTRFALAAHAICTAAHILQPNDRITILLFSGLTRQLVNGRAKAVLPKLPGLLARITPNGPTRPNSALPALYQVLKRKALLVLITDGRIPHLNILSWKSLLLQKAIHFAIVAPRQSSPAVNQLLTATHATHYVSTHFGQWADFLHTAVARHIGGTTQSTILPWAYAAMQLHGNTHQWDRVYVKRSATLVAASKTHALAALWRRGLGQVAAMAFTGGRQARTLQGRLLNRVIPPAGDRRFTITAQHRNSHWLINVQGVSGGKFLDNLQLGLTVIQPQKKQYEITMAQTAPGKYQTRLSGRGHVFSAAVWQTADISDRAQKQLIGRLDPPWLPGNYFPATGRIQRCPWPGITSIADKAPATLLWHPTIKGSKFSLEEILWALSALAALAAILTARRGHVGHYSL